jgi:predicted O-methyltransferase YrrM
MLNFKKDIAPIGGWLTEDEGVFLYQNAKKVNPNDTIVEIGSWKGKSTVCLAKGSQNGSQATIYAVDPHMGSSEHHKMFGKVDTFQEFQQNIKDASVEQYIKPIRETSENASKNFHETVGFLFVDGAHEFKLVQTDIKSWFSKIKNGGIIAFHDSWAFPGPNLATAILLLSSSQIKNPKLTDTISSFEKTQKNSFLDRIKNMFFLLYRILFGWIGAIKLSRKGTVIK